MEIAFSEKVAPFIAAKAEEINEGARPVARLAGELIEKPLAKIAADSEEKFVTKFVDVYDDTIIFSWQKQVNLLEKIQKTACI